MPLNYLRQIAATKVPFGSKSDDGSFDLVDFETDFIGSEVFDGDHLLASLSQLGEFWFTSIDLIAQTRVFLKVQMLLARERK